MNKFAYIVGLFVFAALFGCVGLQSDFETPTVGLKFFRAIPSQGAVPQFEIGLHVVNPNRRPLELEGIVYSVSLEGHKVLTGVANDLPVIEAYGEGDIELLATPDLLSSISFFASLMQKQKQTLTYEFEAKLDVGSFHPRIHVVTEGEISLQGVTR